MIHVATYAIRFRLTTLVSSERTIFLYHALSVAALTAFGVGAVLVDPRVQVVAGVVAAVGLHGIYSLSFLELWSLTEGSYSLRILEHVERAARPGADVDVVPLERLGGWKIEQRLDSLERLGLVGRVGDQIALTYRGRWVAEVLASVAGPLGPPERNGTCG